MRWLSGAAASAIVGTALAAGAASAEPTLEIKNAVASVIVVPETRNDIEVRILRSDPSLPPFRVTRFMGRTVVDGRLWGRVGGCDGGPPHRSVFVRGVGEVTADTAPAIVVRTPFDARVVAGGAVWGRIGYSSSLALTGAGCGDWLIADVRGPLKLVEAGAGDAHAGSAGAADLVTAGSGSISIREVRGPVKATDAGLGDIEIGEAGGPMKLSVAGSGKVRVDGGRVSAMDVAVAGSGDVAMRGEVGELKASVIGSGDIDVARVTGPVSKTVVGSGEVRIGS